MNSITNMALGFSPARSTAGLVLTLESVNNLKLAILELRREIDALKGSPVAWQVPIAVKTVDDAISDLMQVEGVIAPDIQAELNK